MNAATIDSPPVARGGRLTRSAGLGVALAVLAFAALLSLGVGARSIPLDHVVDALLHGGDTQEAAIIRDLRIPRTVLGIASAPRSARPVR